MNVLIGVDDSAESRYAVEVAYRFFGSEASYTILGVGQRVPLFAASYASGTLAAASDLQTLFGAAEAAAQTAAKIAAKIPADDVETESKVGDVGQALVEAADEHDIDVIVIGSRDKNVWQRLFDPSVGRYVIDHANCPVLVAR